MIQGFATSYFICTNPLPAFQGRQKVVMVLVPVDLTTSDIGMLLILQSSFLAQNPRVVFLRPIAVEVGHNTALTWF
jgi:hypothetical protein